MTSTARYPTWIAGRWTELTIPLRKACAPYPCFRVVSVKAIGAVRVGSIRLTEPRGDTTMMRRTFAMKECPPTACR